MRAVFGDPANLVEPEEDEPDGAGEPASALDYLQDVYRGRRVAEHSRMRAAMAALPFESPKLAVTTNLTNGGFAVRLEKAAARSRAPPVIEHREVELPPAGPPGIRGRSGAR